MARPAAQTPPNFCRGGFPHFRWDLLGFAFARTWLSYCLFCAQLAAGTSLYGLPGDAALLLSGAMAALLLFAALQTARWRIAPQGPACAVGACFGLIGTVLLCVGNGPGTGAWHTAAALPFLGASAGLIQTLWCEKFARLPLGDSTLYSLYAMLLASAITVLTNPYVTGIQASTLVFIPAFAIVLLFCRRDEDESPRETSGVKTPQDNTQPATSPASDFCRPPEGSLRDTTARTRDVVRTLALVILARFLYALIYNFIVSALSSERGTSDVGTFASTTFAILVVLAIYFVKRDKFDPAPLYRMVLPIAVAGFAVVHLFFESNAGMGTSMSLLSVGYKVFDLMYWLLLFKITKLLPNSTFLVMGVGVCATYLGMGSGRAFAALTEPLWSTGTTFSNFVIVGCCILVVASVIVLPDRVVSRLWAEDRGDFGEPANGGHVKFDDAIARAAEQCGLSDREREVFALLAQGRSQPFIAERLCIARGTVHAHVARIYAKLDVRSQDALIDKVILCMNGDGKIADTASFDTGNGA